MKAISFVFTILLIVLVPGCKKEEDPTPEASYIGLLTFDYSRTFPAFSTAVIMEVEIDKSGEVYISDPDQEFYDSGEDILILEGGQIKQQEYGTITITALDGSYREINGEGYLRVNASALLDGIQITWAFDEDLGWVNEIAVSFSLEDPVESPMNFNIGDAVMAMNGSQLGATVPAPPFGSWTCTWTLGLAVVP